jgi:isopentenyl phosphate kinase
MAVVLGHIDCIVKLGGSALTIKNQFETLNFASIDA